MTKWLDTFFSLPEVTFYQILAYLALATINAPWFFFVITALLGGFAALAHMDSSADYKFSFGGGLRAVLNRFFISVFIGIIIWLAADGVGYATSPWSRLAAGLCSFYGIKSIDWIAGMGKDFLERWWNARSPAPPTGVGPAQSEEKR